METHGSTLWSEVWKSNPSTGPHRGKPASVPRPRRGLAADQRAYLDLPEADGDSGSGGEAFDDGVGDEVQQEAWRPRGDTELAAPALPSPSRRGWVWAGRGGLVGVRLGTGGPHTLLGLVWTVGKGG